MQSEETQMENKLNFILMANYQGPAKTYTRRIRSKYIHTWLGVDFDSIKIDVTFDERGNIEDVETNIDAELKEKAWVLPSFVAFNF